ncbi:DUF1795 domain-containing protein [Pseudomonas sp. RW407]|uniref:DcrB-related protein n=1 Tax=Pseudomonas sp. RW407 TaxID=2202894 RepID=UPI000D6EE5C7|nr:DUF1795 domain-containing protein [Pseudomonas sp. RW407]PWU27091.1 DUF1795 domain-containing protein [Pseudomonas sp. RW407]
MDYQLQEGQITLPEGYQDRSVNMFVLGNSVPAPLSITVSRDNLLPDETLKPYVERQVKLIGAKLRGYTLLGKKPASLGEPALEGIQVDAYYLNDGRPLYQRQAAFEIEPGRALVFSTTSQGDFSTSQSQAWLDLLASFRLRQAPPLPEDAASDTE